MLSRFAPALAVTALALAVAGPAPAAEIPDIPLEHYRLDNGLGVILHEDHSTPIVGVNIWYHVGSKNERVRRSGFAHLFEHMMFQGSEHHDAEYFGPIQSVGGLLNGSTSEDRTNYWEIVPSNQLERALIMESDRMGFLLPAMTQEKLDNQRDVVRNERRESEGQPYSAFWLTFNENFYPKGHPYDHSVIGIHEDLEAATLEDVKDFFRSYYTPNNATLSIAGDFDAAQAKEWIAEYFGPIPAGPPVQEVAEWVPVLGTEKRIRTEDDVQLARRYYAWHSPPYYKPGDAELDLAARVLGRGTSSRLYRRLVHEEKLAQDVSVHQESQQLGSVFMATVTLRPGADGDRAEQILDEEIRRLAEEGPTEDELERAKSVYEAAFVKGIQHVGGWGGINDRLNRYNHYTGTPDYFRQDWERYMSTTTESVRDELAKWTDPARGRMVVEIVPMGQLEAADGSSTNWAALPSGGDPPMLDAPDVKRKTLPNGLQLAVMEHHELPLVRTSLVFHSGTAADPEALGGLADLTGEMLLEGTEKRDKFAFQEALESLGTDLGSWTSDDYSGLWMLALRKNLDESMGLLAEALLRPAFPEDELADKKERRLNDIRRQRDNPRTISVKATHRIVFGDGHPYSRLGTGSEESVRAIDLDAVQRYADTNFTPKNTTLVAVGDITLEELEKTVSRHLGRWEGEAPTHAEVPAPRAPHGRTVYLIDKPGDTQSTISIAHPGIARNDPDWEKVYVANRVLGGFFSSRLNLNLREDKGYTYGARSGTWELAGPSCFRMSARVQTEVTAPALTEFVSELEGVAGQRPITADELEFAKNSIVLGYPREFETIGELANAISEQVAFGLPDDSFARYPEKIEAVDLATVNATAAEYFDPENVAIIVVGDLEKIEGPIRDLNLGPVRYADRDGRVLDQELSSR
jgi:zinc protease